MDYHIYREEVFKTTQKLVNIDLIRLSSGNISVRTSDGNMAITPSGVIYDKMKPDDIVVIDLNGEFVEGILKPSSEYQLHAEIYKARPDVNGVVHTHSKFGIAFASTSMEIPVSNIELLAVGGPIPVAPYFIPGTLEVALSAASYFTEKPRLKALLLQNHGMVAIGETLDKAYQNAYKTETGAEIYFIALQLGKDVNVLSDKQISEIFSRYQKK
jgi:ribulose-5-phosphate 4-epimerase/fuculose-1-phosphate aldolase